MAGASDARITFLLGPAGSGKTTRCLGDLREELLRDCSGPPLLLLAPKQATFQLERQLLSDPGIQGYTRLQILSFERLARFILDHFDAGSDRVLDEEGRRMVLRALLADQYTELRLFRATSRLPTFAQELSKVLREIQEQRMTPGHLASLADRSENEVLAAKLRDMGALLHGYQLWMQRRALMDPCQILPLAAETLRSSRRAPGHPTMVLGGVWLDGFAELTPQELELLGEVIASSRSATLAFCLPDLPRDEPHWLSAWSGVARTFRAAWNLASGLTTGTPGTVVLPEPAQPTRFSDSVSLGQLADAWTTGNRVIESVADEVRTVVCANVVEEATIAAREIRRHVRSGAGRRYRDVGVLLRSFEGYHDVISRVFKRYEIPFFLDRREPVAHHPLAELIRYALRTVAFGWQHEDWFGALKTGLVPANETALDELENEALARGWSGNDWHRPLHLPDDPALERRLERTRRQVMPAFETFARGLSGDGAGPDGVALAAALSGLWADLGVVQRLEHWAMKRGDAPRGGRFEAVHATVWDQMRTWQVNLELAFSGQNRVLGEWLPIVESGLSGLTVGVIPPALDQVLVGTIDRSRNPDLQLAIVMGLNEGVFPATPAASGLLTREDRDQLEHLGVLWHGSLRARLGREQYLGYIALTRARRVILTYAERDDAGHALNPSAFVSRLRQLMPGLVLEAGTVEKSWTSSEHECELLAPAIRIRGTPEWERLRPVLRNLPSFHRLESLGWQTAEPRLDPALAAILYGPVLRTSVSRLEQFASCPFQFFVHAGLRGAERRRFEIDAREKGSYQHEILARFHHELQADALRWRDITPRQARQRIERLAAAMTREFRDGLFAASSEREAEARRLAVLLGDFIEVAVGWMADYAFDPARVELGFGRDDDPLPAWEIELDGGRRLSFRGKIDRVDIAAGDDPDEALCLVIDYKSSAHPVNHLLLEHGIQMQLPAYLVGLRALRDARAVFGKGRLRPVGMFYVNLRGQDKGGRNRVDVLAGAEAARRKVYRHAGRFDAAFLASLDTRVDARIGDQFNYRRTASGAFHANCKDPMDSTRFQALLDDVAGQIRSLGNRIFAGEIRVDPYREGAACACDRCDAQAICRIDPWTHAYRVLRPQAASPSAE